MLIISTVTTTLFNDAITISNDTQRHEDMRMDGGRNPHILNLVIHGVEMSA